MADINLIPIVSASALQGVTASNIAGNATQVPSFLAGLPAGSLLTGYVLNRDHAGNPLLRTELGDFIIQSTLFLKIGSDVVIRTSGTGANARASIVSVDGQPPNQHTPQQQQDTDAITRSFLAGDAPIATQSRVILQTLANLLQSPVVRALLVSPSIQQTPTAPLAAPLPDQELALKITSYAFPASQPGNPNQPPAATTPSPPAQFTLPNTLQQQTTPQSPTPNATPPLPASASPLQPQAQTQPLSNIPQPTAPATIPSQPLPQQSLPAPPSLVGTVIQHTVSGQPVLSTPLGLIQLPVNTQLPIGTRLVFTLPQGHTGVPPLTTPNFITSANPQAMPLHMQGSWDNLSQIISILQAYDPTILSTLQASLPMFSAQREAPSQTATKPEMGAAIFVFIAALKGGNIRDIIGTRAADALERLGQGGLLKLAEAEFGTLRNTFLQAFQSSQPNWQAMFIPVFTQNGIRMQRWHVKREKQSGNRNEAADDTRFVIEFDVSEMGEFQLDGLVRKKNDQTRFDINIRTHTPLSSDMQQEIISIYHGASLGNYHGTLQFQTASEFPTPYDDPGNLQHSDIIA